MMNSIPMIYGTKLKTMIIAIANKNRYAAVRFLFILSGFPVSVIGSGFTKIAQQTVISATENKNGGSIIIVNSPMGILNLE